MSAVLIGGQASFLAAPERHPLRPYQADDLRKILALLARGVKGTLYECPTGGGKTKIFTEAADVVTREGWSVWIFVHRRELLWQASRALASLGVSHGVIAPGQPLTDDLVQVVSIDTVGARLVSLLPRLRRVHLAIVDEAHHIVAGKWRQVLAQMSQAQILGVTATPFRYDGKGLGDLFTEAVRGPSIGDLIELGYLAPPAVFAPPTNINLAKVKKRAGDYAVDELARVMDTDEVTLPAVRHYAKICGGVPAIAFCVSVEHAHNVAAQFSKAGWAAAAIDGSMSIQQRDGAIQALASGRLQVLTSCEIVSEGTDIPVVGAAILLRPTKSTGLYLQQIGRILRIYEGKTEAIIIDQVANVAEHGMPTERRSWSLAGGLRGLERAVTATRRCRSCFYVCAKGPERCPRCSRKYPVPKTHAVSEVKLAAMPGFGELSAERIASMTLKSLLPLAKTREDLMLVAQIRGYKRGWVDYVMRERSGIGITRRYA